MATSHRGCPCRIRQCTEPWWTDPSRRSGVRFVCLSEADLESLRRELGAQVEAHLAYRGQVTNDAIRTWTTDSSSTHHLTAMARDAADLAGRLGAELAVAPPPPVAGARELGLCVVFAGGGSVGGVARVFERLFGLWSRQHGLEISSWSCSVDGAAAATSAGWPCAGSV